MTRSVDPRPNRMQVSDVPGPDFTTYTGRDDFQVPTEGRGADKDANKYSYSGSLPLDWDGKQVESRALSCQAYRDQFWSITIRCEEKDNRPEAKLGYQQSLRSSLDRYIEGRLSSPSELSEPERTQLNNAKPRDFLGYCPKGHEEYSKQVIPDRQIPDPSKPKRASAEGNSQQLVFLNEIYAVCHKLYEIFFADLESAAHPSGLIAITGATDSSKSLITRGLIFLFLQAAAEQARRTGQRRPHLVTYEDPIEQFYVRDPATKSAPQTLRDLESLLSALYIDYTPREKHSDAENLKSVTRDALRQTPSALFVGETREKEDWKELLQFAGSGHLVITTSHASSVVEAMSGILRDTETKTPSQRSEIARRILGLVNIRSFTPADTNIRALIPAIWKRTSQSMNNLIADGLASILPARDREAEIGYFGRTYFAVHLTEESRLAKGMSKYGADARAKAIGAIRKRAKRWDIRGV